MKGEDILTKEELELLKRLSKPPKCMHPPEIVIDQGNTWKCGKCGLIAKKSIEIMPGVFFNET